MTRLEREWKSATAWARAKKTSPVDTVVVSGRPEMQSSEPYLELFPGIEFARLVAWEVAS